MKIGIIGTGYVGLATGVAFAELGHHVQCHVRNPKRLALLNSGRSPIHEAGLERALRRLQRADRLRFTDSLNKVLVDATVVFIAVGTPMGRQGRADLRSVHDVARQIGRQMTHALVVVTKSTVPVGTTLELKKIISAHQRLPIPFFMANNPEFLREGTALQDFLQPDRIVVGVDNPVARRQLTALYRPLTKKGVPLLVTSIPSSETIKYASNAFLAMKISFVNEVANFSERVGADILNVVSGMGLDRRIGPAFLNAGIGYGGSCFPKDVRALIFQGLDHHSPFRLLPATEKVNHRQQLRPVAILRRIYPTLKGRRIAIWGVSYKPGTDDIRNAPAVPIIQSLLKAGASVRAYDPAARTSAQSLLGNAKMRWVQTPLQAARRADALLLITEWPEFLKQDMRAIRKIMRRPVLIDGRNLFARRRDIERNFRYFGIGRIITGE